MQDAPGRHHQGLPAREFDLDLNGPRRGPGQGLHRSGEQLRGRLDADAHLAPTQRGEVAAQDQLDHRSLVPGGLAALGGSVGNAHAQVRAAGGTQDNRPLALGHALQKLDQSGGLIRQRHAQRGVGIAAALQVEGRHAQHLQGDEARHEDDEQARGEPQADHSGSCLTAGTNR